MRTRFSASGAAICKARKSSTLRHILARIRAARGAIIRHGSDIVLIARTDALQQYGYDEAIKRLKAARDAGADVGFLEGITSRKMARQAVKDLAPFPLMLNMVDHGSTPTIPVREAENIGFRIIIFPLASLTPAYTAIKASLEKVKREGVTGIPKDLTPKRIFDVCGMKESIEIDSSARDPSTKERARM